MSQSLWSRDGFSIRCTHRTARRMQVAIPLEQGRFFNKTSTPSSTAAKCRNPFGAGTVFEYATAQCLTASPSRNPFGAGTVFQFTYLWFGNYCQVAIPLEQGRFFNEPSQFKFMLESTSQSLWSRDGFSMMRNGARTQNETCRNPFGAGTVFQSA